ncbi:MAG: FAD-dependent oxidoreductase [Pseudomonadota bacterium]
MKTDQALDIVVIGAGVAGLVAAWLLGSRHRVTLVEANDYPGGHTHTVDVDDAQGALPVDTGFIVYNEPNYPHLCALLAHLGVPTRMSDMSFSASIDEGRIEYAGNDLDTLFAQRGNLLRPRYLGMVGDILRFNRLAKRVLQKADPANDVSLGEFLDRHRLGAAFRHHYLLPMAAAIWSCPTRTMLRFPIQSFARFFNNHGLLNLVDRPLWRTVEGGSRVYVEKLIASGHFNLVLNTPIKTVRREAGRVFVDALEGSFDAAVFASHADQTLGMLDEPDALERELLGAFAYQENLAWLHSDARLMPRLRKVWSSWNYLGYAEAGRDLATERVAVSYWMNRLQGLSSTSDYFVTLNPVEPPQADKVHGRYVYHHPVFDERAVNAQPRLAQLQGHRRSWYCGSFFGYGFHEDAVRSAVELAARFGIAPPWRQA